ncbi:Nuclear distribution protein nudE-like 1-A [Gossypium arboreum]|uniref:Nuclear distribution protein nudE-like 1-A n=2 Tax=Gossypium arboreum TaxID=29729 RepID=A0A0B0PGV0_GOSAR|nr:hypothetical protein PVK06_002412 [Gossypium arboreum]KHG22606.1 Nuclear distribution protein nudE-like 1-A [Gossypium arboreum]
MEGTMETKAKTLPKRRGTKSGKQKTQAEKESHNESCRRSRLKMKTMHKDRDQEFLKLQADHKTIKTELQYQAKKGIECNEKLQSLEEDNQILSIDLHTMKEELEWTRQIAVALMAFHGHNFTSFDQNYAGDGQVSRASGTGLQNVNGLVGSIPVPTINFQPSMVNFDQQMYFGQDNANIAAFIAAAPAYTADHAASSAAGVSTITGSSSGANPTLVFGSTNNNEKDDDLFSFVKFHLQS